MWSAEISFITFSSCKHVPRKRACRIKGKPPPSLPQKLGGHLTAVKKPISWNRKLHLYLGYVNDVVLYIVFYTLVREILRHEEARSFQVNALLKFCKKIPCG